MPQSSEDRTTRLLRLASQMAGLGSWALSLPDQALQLSPDAAQLLGHVPGPPLSWPALLARLDPADAAALSASLAAGGPVQHTFSLTLPGGTARWLRLQGEVAHTDDGQALRIEGLIQDVSATRRAEAAVQETETRFRALVEGLERVSVQGYDSQRRVIFWNRASERLYGWRREEALGRQLEDLIIPTPMRDGVIEAIRSWLASGVVSVPAEELVLQHKDGSPVPVFSSHSMQRSLTGEALLYCVDVDLSERVAAEAQRQQLEARLREAQKLEALGTLAGGIAHDFNHVLGAVMANAALARDALADGHPALNALDLIARSGQRARGMVQQILSFSRHTSPQRDRVDLVQEAQLALGLLQATQAPGVSLSLSCDQPSLPVLADAAQMQQVLINLCRNAAQALPAGGGQVAVRLARLPGGDTVRLSVSDTGAGMDAVTRERIFEPFFTTKAPGQGSGLGLSVVHGIVTAHLGQIRVESSPGAGTRFEIDLPLAADAAPPAARPAAPDNRPCIAYVDDDEVMRETVQALLARAGYRACLFSSAADALAALPGAIALLVTDFHMPGGDGLALARAVRERCPGLPVVLSSGHITDEMAEGAARLGVHTLLRKERLLEDLIVQVRALLPG